MSFVSSKDGHLTEGAVPVGETLWPPVGLWPALNLQCNPPPLAAQTTGRLGNDLGEVEEVGSSSSSSRGGGLGAEEGSSCKPAYRASSAEARRDNALYLGDYQNLSQMAA